MKQWFFEECVLHLHSNDPKSWGRIGERYTAKANIFHELTRPRARRLRPTSWSLKFQKPTSIFPRSSQVKGMTKAAAKRSHEARMASIERVQVMSEAIP